MRQAKIFYEFLLRDIKIAFTRVKIHLLNNGCISPLLNAFCFGYVLPWVAIGEQSVHESTMICIGGILWSLFPLAVALTVELVFDLEQDRFVLYQTSILSPRLVIAQKIFFSSIVCWLCMLFFFPITKVVMQHRFVIENISVLSVASLLYFGSLFSCSFTMAVQTTISSSMQLENLWLRVYYPMLLLAGGMVPWSVYRDVSPVLGFVTQINPLMYLTDGLRSAIIGSGEFFAVSYALGMLAISSLICMLISMYNFKRKVDHI